MAAIKHRCVRTASGSDRILRATQQKPHFTSYCVIRSLPLAVPTLTRSYSHFWLPQTIDDRVAEF